MLKIVLIAYCIAMLVIGYILQNIGNIYYNMARKGQVVFWQEKYYRNKWFKLDSKRILCVMLGILLATLFFVFEYAPYFALLVMIIGSTLGIAYSEESIKAQRISGIIFQIIGWNLIFGIIPMAVKYL